MNQEVFSRLRDWVEPAHPAIIERYADLVAIYTLIRDKYQKKIDQVFDHAAKMIGFVVATTIPVVFELDEKSFQLKMGAEHLQGTLFEQGFSKVLNADVLPAFKGIRPGTYSLYLVWFEALRLKLRTDWLEPVHFQRAWLQDILKQAGVEQEAVAAAAVRPEVREPAHWFDPGMIMEVEDAMLISAIDEIYPELRLADRVASFRQAFLRIPPEVQEPAHFRQIEQQAIKEVQQRKASG
jgi:hypothetical protein